MAGHETNAELRVRVHRSMRAAIEAVQAGPADVALVRAVADEALVLIANQAHPDISTVEELAELPYQTVIRDSRAEVWEAHREPGQSRDAEQLRWSPTGGMHSPTAIHYPAAVIFTPTPQEQEPF